MDILLIRHATAEEPSKFARHQKNDDLRPLTDSGIGRMQEGVRGLRYLVRRIDTLATSPLTRAHQTAEIIAKDCCPGPIHIVPELAPGADPANTARWLAEQDPNGIVCAVGHQPDLSSLITWLVCGHNDGFFDFKKGGACLLGTRGIPEQGRCVMRWALTPKQLRALGRS